MNKLIVGATALLLAAGAGVASANPFDVDLSLGYSRLRIDGANAKDLDKSDGAAARASIMFPQPAVPGLKIGFSIESSAYRNDFHEIDSDGDNRHRYHELDLLVPELRVAYNIPIDHFFIEPSLGIGPAIGDYRIGTRHHHHRDGGDFDEDDSETVRVNLAVQPTLRIGYQQNHWAVGLEASYLDTHLHFKDGIGGDISEMYGGAFFQWTF